MEDISIVIGDRDRRLPKSAAEAKEILQSIRISRGFLGKEHEEEVSHLDVGLRQAIRRLQESLRRKTAKYTNSIAGELYSSKTRFFYELLQNADDSDYQQEREEPRVTISLYPDRVLIDTNETGFTIANVKAICDTGESSKKSSAEDKSIGEKGYGFKSVFAVAHRARIQSGHWSFYFEHREGDDGLGMITPIDIDPVDLPFTVNTRIELSLNDATGALFQKLSHALSNLHDTTIFFLQKIETLVLHMHSDVEAEIGREIKRKIISDDQAVLHSVVSLGRRDTVEGSGDIVTTRLYHVFAHEIYDMPADRHRKGRSHSTLKMAFPFDPLTKLPLIDASGQQVFAYLPLYQKTNLPFLIQGDFITSTSRENVLDCDWNDHLRIKIAAAFCEAVACFYCVDVLRYRWLEYLPVLVAGGFEAPLFSLINAELQEAKVFETWQSRSPANLAKVRIVPSSFTHDKAPLFEDLPEEAYLAPEYAPVSFFLSKIGILKMPQLELLERLAHDLRRPESRLRNTPASDPWHETCSSALAGMLSAPTSGKVAPSIQALKIIPLRYDRGGSPASISVREWISALEIATCPVNFPETRIASARNLFPTRDSLTIPLELGIRVVHQQSSTGPHRLALFAKLGVISCPPTQVTDAIFEYHRPNNDSRSQLISTRVSHLQYLFWFYDPDGPITRPLMIDFGVEKFHYRSTTTPATVPIYLRSDSYYDAWSLLKGNPNSEIDMAADFVSMQYMEAEASTAVSHGRSWLQWLETIVGLRRRPALTALYGTGLSRIMLHILKTRPADFIPTLQAHWMAEYEQVVAKSEAVRKLLSSTEVRCERISPTALSRTWLPTEALRAEAQKIGLLEHIPFLSLPNSVTNHGFGRWDFLTIFGVGSQIGLGFYLDLLTLAQRLDTSGALQNQAQIQAIVTKIYTKIGTLCNLNQARFVKEKLIEGRGIYVPSNAAGERWRQPGECLWDAPHCISIKSTLATHYNHDHYISTLLRSYAQVPEVHVNDYLDQLRHFKRSNFGTRGFPVSHKVCAEVYEELYKIQATTQLLDHMRDVIEKEKLIFVKPWHSPSECLWSTDTSISDQVSIAGIYPDLEDFFVTRLRVKKLTISMLVSDLKSKATAKAPLGTASAKLLIYKINAMLPNEALDSRLQGKFNELEGVKCFPVRGKDGHVMLTDAKADFAIVDNKRFGEAFTHEADLLDFSLDEVHVLRPLLEATRLTNHYLSGLVEEVSDIEGSPAQSSELTDRLHLVAYALFCCAVHFKSNKIVGQNTSLYRSLLSISVHEAEKMGTSLLLEQHGRKIKVPSTKAQLKIDTDTDPWRIYVPKDTKTRKSCYSSQLPQNILGLLGISGNNATLAVNRLINELHDRESESSVLEQFDVLPISWIERQSLPQTVGSCVTASETVDTRYVFGNARSSTTSTPAPSSFTSTSFTPSAYGSPRPSTNSSASFPSSIGETTGINTFGGPSVFGSSSRPFTFGDGTTTARSASATPLPTFNFGSAETSRASSSGFGQRGLFGSANAAHRRSVSASPESPFIFGASSSTLEESRLRLGPTVQTEKYRALLGRLINRVSGHNNIWNFNGLQDALPETVRIPLLFDKDETFGVRNEGHMAHDMKIGAAGEVFVFEKMLAAGLPGFSRNNWLSTIRHEAKVHERYQDLPDKSPDLPSDSRAEPADIVYADIGGDFAKFLRTQDCVGVKDWLEEPPNPKRKYFIEVKTTTRSCDTTFYMSKGQHSRMLDMRKKLFTKAIDDVYIICRVYNLLSNDVNMRFYISPGRDEEMQNSSAPGSSGATASTPFATTIGNDAPSSSQTNAYQSITFMQPYERYSFEELRLADYLAGSTDCSPGGAFSFAAGQNEPILEFTSKGFEVRPVK